MASPDSSIDAVQLLDILPLPYNLVYAIPLLVLSVPITFGGAFLTLDRTRSFIPSNKLTDSKATWRFEGGLGGLLAGFVYGNQLVTCLALLIMNRTDSAKLGGIQFLVIWLLSSIALAVLSCRFKLAAIAFLGTGGGVAFSLFISIASHPAPLARIILLGVSPTILTILALIPIPSIQHGALRAGGAFLGAFGVMLSVSILAGASGWTNIWSRLWVASNPSWGSGQEKGMTAAYAIMAALGIASDWGLKRMFGENPDQKWDSYLASYAANLPNAHDRPGTFTPSVPWWKRVINPPAKDPIIFPPDSALAPSSSSQQHFLGPTKLKNQHRSTGKYDSHTKFQPLATKGDFSSGSSDSSDSEGEANYIPRPWAVKRNTTASTSRASLSGATLAGSDGGKKKKQSRPADYSDGESATPSKDRSSRDTPGWTPEFIKRHSSISARSKGKLRDLESGPTDVELGLRKSPPTSPNRTNSSTTAGGESAPPGAVPVTPSLIKALDRVSRAQSTAYGGTPAATPGQQDWGVFWKAVGEKAKESDTSSTTKK